MVGVALAGMVVALAAEPAAPGFVLLDTITASYSATARTDLRGDVGGLSVWRAELEAGGRTPLGGAGVLIHGIALARTDLDRPAASLLPERLQEVSLRLGWMHQPGPRWRFNAMLRPGFFGDGGSVGGATFNAPFLGLASIASSRELIWSFGLIANAFGDNPVLPVAGVRWEFAPSWRFDLGYPRAGVAWELSPAVSLTAGATFQGGAYRLSRRPAGAPLGATWLDGAKLDYREIRLGIGGSFALAGTLRLTLDAGVAVDQRFDFHRRGIEFRGDDAGFGAVALSGRF